MPDIIALITARGGSKSIPRKNVIPLAGKPLIAWSIETALQSGAFSKVIVSTDDKEISQIAHEWGAVVPFIRPESLARDDSSHISVVLHALQWLKNNDGAHPDYIMLLQPTSPLRTIEDIHSAIRIAQEKKAKAVVSVCEATHHPYLSRRLSYNGTLESFISSNIAYTQRQVLPPAYAINGAIYLNRCTSLISDQSFLPSETYPYIMPQERSLDIDEPWQLYVAECLLRSQHEKSIC